MMQQKHSYSVSVPVALPQTMHRRVSLPEFLPMKTALVLLGQGIWHMDGRAAPDVDRAMKLAEQLEEEYQQLKRVSTYIVLSHILIAVLQDVECWKARAEDTSTKILPLLKRRQMFSDALDVVSMVTWRLSTNNLFLILDSFQVWAH
jgi:hypothetical protein